MAHVQVTYWREIPVLVRAWDGTDDVSVPLSPRFQDLVDTVAMQDGLSAAQDYLAEWRTGPDEERPGPARPVASGVAAALEARFGAIRARSLRPIGSADAD
jgi:hypothetical protein